MSRDKLEKLGIRLPLLPVTSVGSFPKPYYLQQARADHLRGLVGFEELRNAERRATEFWIATQERIGIDVLVDGEQYRGDMVTYFAENMPGFEIGGLIRSYGNRYYHKPVIVSQVGWPGPVTVDWWKYAQSLTPRPVKAVITGAYTFMDWSFNQYYSDRKSVCFAIAKAMRKEIQALIDTGAKIIQIDEPATSARSDELEIVVEAMQMITDGLPAYFITHICYGDLPSVYPGMLRIPVDNFDLETANSDFGILGSFKEYPFTADISLGAVDVHSHKIETVETVKERIERSLRVLPLETVWIAPDCGLKTRTVDEAIGKLKVIVEAASGFRV